MNEFHDDLPGTAARTRSERHIDAVGDRGGIFVEAVRLTRMPMLVTDASLPGNPIVFANNAFIELSGYGMEELAGQDPHFMNGAGTDPEAIRHYEEAIAAGQDVTLEILQYRKDAQEFRAMLFASPLSDGQGTVTHHFLSYLDISRRYDAEEQLRGLTAELEARVAERTKELMSANIALTTLAAEREMLMIEVNHRAKNSLTIAASLLSIQGRRQHDPHVKALFHEAEDRLIAMARVHDLLSRSESLQKVDLAIYIVDLCEALRPITENDDRIRLEAEVDPNILIEAVAAVPLGIIIVELITNAVKYAFPAPAAGTVRLRAMAYPNGLVQLVVQDDGVGMSALREGSLGYGLVRSLVQQIDGQMDWRSEGGLIVTVTFPGTIN